MDSLPLDGGGIACLTVGRGRGEQDYSPSPPSPEGVKKLECTPSPNPLPPGERVIILK